MWYRPPTGVAQTYRERPFRKDVPMYLSNLTIANIFLFFAILCMVLSAAAALPLYFVYSTAATAMAGAVRYNQLPHDRDKARRH
jgi:hypothetical protein